jgi:excisionase family DNA binding protein
VPPRRNCVIKTKKRGVVTFDGGGNPGAPNTKSYQRQHRDQDRGVGEDDEREDDDDGEEVDAAKSALAPTGSELLTVREAAIYLRCSRSLLNKLRVRGGGPKFINLGGDLIRYHRRDLDDFVEARTFRNTAQVVVE